MNQLVSLGMCHDAQVTSLYLKTYMNIRVEEGTFCVSGNLALYSLNIMSNQRVINHYLDLSSPLFFSDILLTNS